MQCVDLHQSFLESLSFFMSPMLNLLNYILKQRSICLCIFFILTLKKFNLEIFDFLNYIVFYFIPSPSYEIISPLFNFVGHCCLDVVFTFNFFIHPNHDVIPFKYDIHYGFGVVEGINYESTVREVISKSHFFDIDTKK